MQTRSIEYGGSNNLASRLRKTLDKFTLFTGACVFYPPGAIETPAELSYYEYSACDIDLTMLGRQYKEAPGAVIINKSPIGGSNCITVSSLGKVMIGLSPLSTTSVSISYIYNKQQRVPKQERSAIIYGDLQVGHAPGLASPTCLRGLHVPVHPAADIFNKLVNDATLVSTKPLPIRESAHSNQKQITVSGTDAYFESLNSEWKESLKQIRQSMQNDWPATILSYTMRIYDCVISPSDAWNWILQLLAKKETKADSESAREPEPKVLRQNTPMFSVLFRMAAKMPHKLLSSPQTGRGFQDSLLLVSVYSSESYKAHFYEY